MSHRILDEVMIDGQKVDTSRVQETGKVYVGDEEWDVDDLITEDNLLADFKDGALRTKDDLLFSINWLLKEIREKSQEDAKHSPAYYTRYEELIHRFRSEVEAHVFPEDLEDWWSYVYDVMDTGVTLQLEHVSNYSLDRKGNPEVQTDTTFQLLHVPAILLTVEQYAQAYGVTTTTVRQWIRRGKIRSAVKRGSEWRIPELAEVLERGYSSGRYERLEYLTDLPEEYTFFNDYKRVWISQDQEHKDMFTASFRGNEKPVKNIQMDQKTREKFELMLISNPFVRAQHSYITSRG